MSKEIDFNNLNQFATDRFPEGMIPASDLTDEELLSTFNFYSRRNAAGLQNELVRSKTAIRHNILLTEVNRRGLKNQ